jgi:predicted negative regulator of RcsB-dependent stress response
MGWIAIHKGKYRKARKFLEEAYLAFDANDNKEWASIRLADLGFLALLMGDLDEAQKRHQQALDIRKGMGNERTIAYSIANLGIVALKLGEFGHARDRLEEALRIFQKLGDEEYTNWTLCWFGDLALAMGNFTEAWSNYCAALDFLAASQNAGLCLLIIAGLAEMYEKAGIIERAVELAALTQSHPEAGLLARERGKNLLDELGEKLPTEIFTEAQERGKGLDLWATVDELLTELDG